MKAPSFFKQTVGTLALGIQNSLKMFPREVCLITGAPRSGTSALCSWLGSQRVVSAFPESRILVSAHRFMDESFRFKNLENDNERMAHLARDLVLEYYSGSRLLAGRKLVVDKEPLEPIAFPSREYGRFLSNVKKILPDIKVLFAVRDPVATVWSMSQRTWGESLTIPESRRFSLEEYAENWCACADLAFNLASDLNVYIVQFGRLVGAPEIESQRIFDFLGIHNGVPFDPRPTHPIGFSNAEREKILYLTQPCLEKLASKGFII